MPNLYNLLTTPTDFDQSPGNHSDPSGSGGNNDPHNNNNNNKPPVGTDLHNLK